LGGKKVKKYTKSDDLKRVEDALVADASQY
jgi:hypothetical protein